jgi:hypothetical protein
MLAAKSRSSTSNNQHNDTPSSASATATTSTTATATAAAAEAPLLQPHGGDDNRNEPIFAARLLVKALRALEAPEGEGSAAHGAGPTALLAALERAVERRVSELPPGYLAAEEGLVKGAWWLVGGSVGEEEGKGGEGTRAVYVYVCVSTR